MYCPVCGQANEEANRFCKQCGRELPANLSKAAIPGETVPTEGGPIAPQVSAAVPPPTASATADVPVVPTHCPRCGSPVPHPAPPFCQMCGMSLGVRQASPAESRPKEPARTVPAGLPAEPPADLRQAATRLYKKMIRPALVVAVILFITYAAASYLMQKRPAERSPFSVKEPPPACTPITAGSNYEEANTNDLEGDLLRDSVFLSGEEYTIRENRNFVVPEGVTLVIEPGARIRFGAGSRMVIRGELLACGKSNLRIFFTADQKTGQPGHWQGLAFDNASPGSVLGHATFEYGGGNNHPVIWVNGVNLNLEDLSFASNAFYPLSVTPESFPQMRPPFNVESGPEGWEIRSGQLDEDLVWDTDQPLVISGRLRVAAKVTLTVAAGSRVKFMPDSALEVYGRVVAQGTAAEHILITSANDVSADAGSRAWSGIVFVGDQAGADMTYVDYRYEEAEPGNE